MSEQERAEQLAQAIDRLMAGEPIPTDDPLLNIAETLAQTPLQAREPAVARFERQVDQWFGPRPEIPRRARHIPPTVIAGIVLIVVIVIALIALLWTHRIVAPLPTASATETIVPTWTTSPTTSATPTRSATPTATANPTNTPSSLAAGTSVSTPPVFSRVIVSGQIDAIQKDTIVILGQRIRIDGDIRRLCPGSVVHIEVSVDADGTFYADQSAVIIEVSGCSVTPVPPAPPNNANNGQPNGDDCHCDDQHHDSRQR